MRQPWRASTTILGAGALLVGILAAGSASFSNSPPGFTCTGTAAHPGTLTGTYASVHVTGVCQVNAGHAVVNGNLTVSPGAALIAAFGKNKAGVGPSDLTVGSDLLVMHDATLILGCEASQSPCFDDPDMKHPTLNSPAVVGGSLKSTSPLGVIVHNASIGGSVSDAGSGGGVDCKPHGYFAVLHSPVFNAYEDTAVGGDLTIKNMASCWLGVARVQVFGSMHFSNNTLADADAIEIISNQIGGGLACTGNSRVWDSTEVGHALFPRSPMPNNVRGTRSGQCVLATPTTAGGPSGPGAF